MAERATREEEKGGDEHRRAQLVCSSSGASAIPTAATSTTSFPCTAKDHYPHAVSSFFRSVSDSDDSSSDEEEALSDSGDDSGIEGKVTKKTKKIKGSDSDSDSDDSDDSDSDAEEKKEAAGGVKKSRFLKGGPGSESGESDDERTKVVKSAKSKRIDEVEASVKAIENAGRINDWHAISNGT